MTPGESRNSSPLHRSVQHRASRTLRASAAEVAWPPESEVKWAPAELGIGGRQAWWGVDVDPPGLGDPAVDRHVRREQPGVRDARHAEGGPGRHPVEDGRLEDVESREHEAAESAHRPGRLPRHAPYTIVPVELDEPVPRCVRI